MTRAPAISVLLPVRDGGRHLGVSIRSILRQTEGDLELICVDDGSEDETPDLLRRLARSDPRVNVIRQERRGLVAALQLGLARARGSVVARMDADDVSHRRRFEAQLALLRSEPGLSAVSCMVRAFPASVVRRGMDDYLIWSNGVVTPDQIRRQLLVECPIVHPTLMVRRRVLEEIGGYRAGPFPEDYELVLRLHRAGHAVRKVGWVLHAWRERPERLTRTDPRYSRERFLDLKADHLSWILARRPRPVVIVGAGVVGKPLARLLSARGHGPVAFIDPNPRKVGGTIHGAPVRPPADIPALRGALFLAAVSARGQRDIVRAELERWGLVEEEDYLCVV